MTQGDSLAASGVKTPKNGGPALASASLHTALVVDFRPRRQRRPVDIFFATIYLLSVLALLGLSLLVQKTVLAVSADFQTVLSTWSQKILLVPSEVIMRIITICVPLTLILQSLWRRRWIKLLTMLLAVPLAIFLLLLTDRAVALMLSGTKYFLLDSFGQTVQVELWRHNFALFPVIAALSALLGAQGSGGKIWKFSWVAVALLGALSVIQAERTLLGVICSIFLGIAAGWALRFLVGVEPNQARPDELVRTLRQLGLDALEVIRLDGTKLGSQAWGVWEVHSDIPLHYAESLEEKVRDLAEFNQIGDTDSAPEFLADLNHKQLKELGFTSTWQLLHPEKDAGPLVDSARCESTLPAEFLRDPQFLTYLVRSRTGQRYLLRVFNPNSHLLNILMTFWARIKLQKVEIASRSSKRETAEHYLLMNMAVKEIGLAGGEIKKLDIASENAIFLYRLPRNLRSFNEVYLHSGQAEQDELLKRFWQQIVKAHRAGLAHQNICASKVFVDANGQVQLWGWENGEISASEMLRRIDLAQALAFVASFAGEKTALEAAKKFFTDVQLASLGPLLQKVLLPDKTCENLAKTGLRQLRESVLELLPEVRGVDLEIRRFSLKTIVTTVILVGIIWVLLTAVNWSETVSALKQGDLRYLILAVLASLLGYIGAGLTLCAFSAEKLSLWRTSLVQMAGAVVSLVAPAGIGPAAVNLRYLHKSGLKNSLAVATVTLTQIFQFLVTIALLFLLGLFSGGRAPNAAVPHISWPLALGVLAGLLIVFILMLLPPVRNFVWRKIGPTLQGIWPQILWVLTSPRRLLLGLLGNFLTIFSLVACFGFSLLAFGQSLPILTLVVTYLISNSLGSVVPTPGGLGPVEAALTGGLVVAGVPYIYALPAVLTYRMITFWGRAPFGWLTWKWLLKKNYL